MAGTWPGYQIINLLSYPAKRKILKTPGRLVGCMSAVLTRSADIDEYTVWYVLKTIHGCRICFKAISEPFPVEVSYPIPGMVTAQGRGSAEGWRHYADPLGYELP